jgi:beta-glucosidase
MTWPVKFTDAYSSKNFPIDEDPRIDMLNQGKKGNVKNVDYTNYEEDIYVGYRYFDSFEVPVSYPFGFGLSYTTFEYSNLRLSADAIKDTDSVTATVTVKNTGRRAGKAVVQLYVGDAEGYRNAIRPVRELKGFEKVELAPGESRDVSFTLCKRAFARWNTTIHDWWVESGDFTIEADDSVANLPLKVTVKVESTVELPRNYDTNSIFMDVMQDPKALGVMKPFIDQLMAAFSPDPAEAVSEAAGEAVSEDMGAAMMNYMPLRGVLSFGGGKVSDEMMAEMLRRINE